MLWSQPAAVNLTLTLKTCCFGKGPEQVPPWGVVVKAPICREEPLGTPSRRGSVGL